MAAGNQNEERENGLLDPRADSNPSIDRLEINFQRREFLSTFFILPTLYNCAIGGLLDSYSSSFVHFGANTPLK